MGSKGGGKAARSPGGFTARQLIARGVDPEDIRLAGVERIMLTRPDPAGRMSLLGGDPDGVGSAELATPQRTPALKKLQNDLLDVVVVANPRIQSSMAKVNTVFRRVEMRVRWKLKRRKGEYDSYWVV